MNRMNVIYVVEAVGSNINGDPDNQGRPRTTPDDKGFASDVSLKAKIRNLVEDKSGPVWKELKQKFNLKDEEYNVFIKREKGANKSKDHDYIKSCFDFRLFGSTSLDSKEENDKDNKKDKKANRFCAGGAVTTGDLFSINPVEIIEYTTTNPPTDDAKESGLAPLATKIVRHAVYVGNININPQRANITGLTETDVNVFLELLKYVYSSTSSRTRPHVEARHVYVTEFNNPLGGKITTSELLKLLTPKPKNPDIPSKSYDDYDDNVDLNAIQQKYGGRETNGIDAKISGIKSIVDLMA